MKPVGTHRSGLGRLLSIAASAALVVASCGSSSTPTPTVASAAPGSHSLHATLQTADTPVRRFVVDDRASTHVRHQHKYADAPLPAERQFYFHNEDAGPEIAAASLAEFDRLLRRCDLTTLDYHLSRADFSRWIIGTLADQQLGTELASIERDLASNHDAALEHARQQIQHAVTRRYLAH